MVVTAKVLIFKTSHVTRKNKREKEKIQVRAPVFDCSQLSFWNSNQSNSINGSDGSAFHPLLTKDERIYIFTPDLCRYELPVPVFSLIQGC